MQAVAAPIAATALVRAMHACLSQEDFFAEAAALSALHQLLVILLRVTKRHASCHTHVIALVMAALAAVGSAQDDFAKAFLHLLLELLLVGRVREVLEAVLVWAQTADPSLVRAFSFQVRSPTRYARAVVA